MTTYEYYVATLQAESEADLTRQLNRLGREGWKAYQVIDKGPEGFLVFMQRSGPEIKHVPGVFFGPPIYPVT